VETCKPYPGGLFTPLTVCSEGAPYIAGFCGEVIGETETNDIVVTDLIVDVDVNLDTFISLPEDETDFQIVSLNEWANYKLGMDPDDLIFQMALDRMIEHAEDPDISAAVFEGLYAAKAGVTARASVARGLYAGDTTVLAALDEWEADSRRSIDNSIAIYTSIGDPSYPQRRLRLGEYAMDSDLMYYYLVETVIGLYLDYRQCQYAGLLPPSVPLTCELDWPLSPEVQAAFDNLEVKLLVYTKDYLQRWKDKAYQMKTEYWASKPQTAGPELFGDLNTPDFVDKANAALSGEYLDKQSEEVRHMHESMAAGGVFVAGSIVAASTAAYVSAFGIGAATAQFVLVTGEVVTVSTSLTVGSALTGSAAAAGYVTSLSMGGVIAAAAGPVAIVGAAVAIGVVTTKLIFEEGKKLEKYSAFMDFDVAGMTTTSLLALDNDVITNIMYMWLMLDAPVGVSNTPTW
jgi:hypothetical protein